MTAKDLVDAVRAQASDGAAEATLSCLETPPGRTPSTHDLELSKWYRSLSTEDQNMVKAVVTEAAQQAVFSFLALLDGVASLSNDHHEGKLQLFYAEPERRVLVNDPTQEELHNLFNQISTESRRETNKGTLRPYEIGPASALLRKSVPGDCLEIHHVLQKQVASLSISGFDAEAAPAIALPKGEHRRTTPN